MKITDVESAAAAFPDAPEECREWCRLGPKRRFVWHSRYVLSVDEAVSRTAKVALELMDLRSIPGYTGRMETARAFLRIMEGADDD